MQRRDGTALGLALVILHINDISKEIFKILSKVCSLSGIIVEAPYKRGIPGQCHRCRLYGHAAANCHAQPRCVKCLVSHWIKDCNRSKETGGIRVRVSPEAAGGDEFRPAPPSTINPWNKLPKKATSHQQVRETTVRESPKSSSFQTGTTASALGEDINTIMSILQVVKSVEVAELASKFRKAKHGEIDTPILNNIPNDIVSTDDIDFAIGALTNHITTVVENSSRTVSTNSSRRELPRDVSELIRAKKAALRRTGKYPTCENRSLARTLQRKVK
ncbi:hypothetical protein EVAR_97325_1 [Eumeta japonica]|uniref:Nucleic-acid-binding protein from transposon X-element n=1 Tax=Eumeta variegata TaxID=151549 RepID=A0A4C1X7U6_EUMVA|nr:hypothetical protein EVAR_97325_1 [Eumeta japonica]